MNPNWLTNHRPPFIFCIVRPHAKKKGRFTSEWLMGEIGRDDVVAEAEALLTDPRDTICSLNVWSVKEGQFVGGFK